MEGFKTPLILGQKWGWGLKKSQKKTKKRTKSQKKLKKRTKSEKTTRFCVKKRTKLHTGYKCLLQC